MKKLATILALGFALATQVSAVEWLTDYPKALELAKKEHKKVMLHFTGSDWCPPCKRLHATVMTSKEFEAYAEKHFVLVELDYPRTKEQSKELKEANKALQEKYKIEGFPTVIVLNSDGKEFTRQVGYGGAKTEEYIATLEKPKK